MLQLKKFPDIPVSTREEARESRAYPEEPRFRLLAREEGSFPCVVGKEFPAFPAHLKRRRSPHERQEELEGRATIPRVRQKIPVGNFIGLPRKPSYSAFFLQLIFLLPYNFLISSYINKYTRLSMSTPYIHRIPWIQRGWTPAH